LQGIDGAPDWSVKSYGDISNFKSVVGEHPGSDHYVVNTELFEQLKSTGDLNSYSENGIVIIDGKFSHLNNTGLAQERLSKISGDIVDEISDGLMDDIPVVATIITISNIGFNYYKVKDGQCSTNEAYLNVLGGVGKLSASSGGAAAGSALGAALGSMVFPLVGTLIGSGVGAFLGSMGARGIQSNIYLKWKWKDTFRAYNYFALKYQDHWPKELVEAVKLKYFHFASLEKLLLSEQNRFKNYKNELDLQHPEKPSISAVLISESINKLKKTIVLCQEMASSIQDELVSACIDLGIKKYPRERDRSKDYAKTLYGAVLAENIEGLVELNNFERDLVKKMKVELKKTPNNPFCLNCSKDEFLGAIIIAKLLNEGESNE